MRLKFVIFRVKMPFRKVPDKPQRSGVVDEQIDEAIERGEFDNLRGKGKPLDLSGDLANNHAMRTKIRHNAGFTAPWEDVAREIEIATSRAESSARRAWEFRLAGLKSSKANPAKIEADFEAARREVQTQIAAVNSLILKYNLLIPPLLPHLHRVRLRENQVWEKIAPEWSAQNFKEPT
jgi:hypothetical protein